MTITQEHLLSHIGNIMSKKAVVPAPQGQPPLPAVGASPGQAIAPVGPGGAMDPAMMGMDPAMMGGAPPMDPAMMGGAPPMDPAMMGGAPPEGGPDMQAELDEVKTTLQNLIDGQTAMLEVLMTLVQGSEPTAPGAASAVPEVPTAPISPEKLSNLLQSGVAGRPEEGDINAINRVQRELRG